MIAEISPQARRLELPGAINLRELGGLPVAGGGSIRTGRLLRSGCLSHLGDAAASALIAGYPGLRMLDLRTQAEVAQDGKPAALIRYGATWVRLPIADKQPGSVVADQYERYLRSLPDYAAAARRYVQLAAAGPVIVCCSLGKDRSGVVCALALLALRVPAVDVVADFLLSNVELPRSEWIMRRNARRRGVRLQTYLDQIRVDSGCMYRLLAAIADGEKRQPGRWLCPVPRRAREVLTHVV